jgi:hypothetical protein
MILQKLKTAAEEYLGQPVTRAVITTTRSGRRPRMPARSPASR